MLNIEQKYVLSLITNKNELTIEELKVMDKMKVIDILIEHKIFLHYIEKIKNDPYFTEYYEIIEGLYQKQIQKQKILDDLMFELIEILEKNSIEYCIYKGKVLDYIIYGKANLRMYNDIDLVINEQKNVEKFLKIINVVYKLKINTNILINSLNGEIVIDIPYKKHNISVEIKNKEKSQLLHNNASYTKINILNKNIYTYDLETTFLSLINYYYYFTQNIFSIQFSNRYILQYLIDMYHFIIKYRKKINIDKIKLLALKLKIYHKIRLALLNLIEIFKTKEINTLLSHFPIDLIDYQEVDYLDKGRFNLNIPLVYKFLYRNEIGAFLTKFCQKDFLLGKSNNNYLLERYNRMINGNKVVIKIKLEDNNLIIECCFEQKIPKEFAIYVQLYGVNSFSEIVLPFIPIMIHMANGEISITKSMMERNLLFYDMDLEKRAKKILNTSVEYNDNNIFITSDLNEFGIDINDKIGLNIIVYNLKNARILDNVQLIPYCEPPVILR